MVGRDMFCELDTPVVIIDIDQAGRNINKIIEGFKKAGVKHRPHIKAHKCVTLAKLQIEMGADGITCAKLGEAEVMMEKGISDILIAYEIIGEKKIERLIALNKKGRVISCIDSIEGAEALSEAAVAAGIRLPVHIEINSGGGRCGRKPGSDLLEFAKTVKTLPGIEIIGIMTYSGQIYGTVGEEMQKMAKLEAETLMVSRRELEEAGIPIKELSGGSSPSAHYPEELTGITESRAGNYILNDCTALFGGICTVHECALRVIAAVISTPEPGRAVIDAGSKTLTSDGCPYRAGYGYVVEYPEIEIYKLNEEHGFMNLNL
jgi:D-serine deaminase-like pyridoxal phosphate-dependent protein